MATTPINPNPAPPAQPPSLEDVLAAKMSAAPPADTSQPPAAPPPLPPTPDAAPPAIPPAPATPAPPAEAQPPAIEDEEFRLDLDAAPGEDTPPPPPPIEAPTPPEAPPGEKQADGKYVVDGPRWQKIYQAHQERQALAKPPEPDGKGGIGFAPTIAQIKDFYDAYIAEQQQLADYAAGDPQQRSAWVRHWFPKTANVVQPSPDAAPAAGPSLQMAQLLPHALRAENPAAYRALSTSVIAHEVESLEALARSGQYTPEDAKKLLGAASVIRYLRFGDVGAPAPSAAPAAAVDGQPQADPESARLRLQNQRLQQELEAARRQGMTVARQVNENKVNSALQSALMADAGRALDKIKPLLDPLVYEGIRDKFASEVWNALTRDESAMALINLNRDKAVASGDDRMIQLLVRTVRQRYEPTLIEKRGLYLKAAGTSLKSSTDQQAKVLGAAAEKVAPAPSVQIPTDHAVNRPERRPDETQQDFMERLVTMRIGGGAAA